MIELDNLVLSNCVQTSVLTDKILLKLNNTQYEFAIGFNSVLQLFEINTYVSKDTLLGLISQEVISYLLDSGIILTVSHAYMLSNNVDEPIFALIGFPLVLSNAFSENPAKGLFEFRTVFKNMIEQSGLEQKVIDYGNIEITVDHNSVQSDKFKNNIKDSIEKKLMPVSFGGDHTITFYALQAMDSERDKNLPFALIVIDAHSDTYELANGESSSLNNSNFVNYVVDELNIPCYSIGVRDHKIRKNHRNLNFIDINFKKLKSILKKLPKKYSYYLSIDSDILDPAFAPEVNYPSAVGLLPRELVVLTSLICKKRDIVGIDITEICNTGISYNATAACMSKILINLLKVINERNRN